VIRSDNFERDFLPLYSSETTLRNRTCLLRPESRAPLLLILLATTCSFKKCPSLSLTFMVTTIHDRDA
jgi:hypothetical protein